MDSSYGEFDNWNPMADDYNAQFNSHRTHSNFGPLAPFLYVKNIPYELHKERVLEIFSSFGKVTQLVLKSSKLGYSDKSYGFVHFASVAEAKLAYSRIDKNNIFDMHVQLGKTNPSRNSDHGENKDLHQGLSDPRSRSIMNNDYEVPQERTFNRNAKRLPFKDNLGYRDNADYNPANTIYNANHHNIPLERGHHDFNPNARSTHASNIEPEVNPRTSANYLPSNDVGHTDPERRDSHRLSDQAHFYERNGIPPSVRSCNEQLSRLSFEHNQPVPQDLKKEPVSHCNDCPKDMFHQSCHSCHHAVPLDHVCHTFQSPPCHHSSGFADTQDAVKPGYEHSGTMPPLKQIFPQCSYCQKDGRFACENCNEPYCSRRCQTEDWNLHKKICRGIKPKVELLPSKLEKDSANVFDAQQNEPDSKTSIYNQKKGFENKEEESEKNTGSWNHTDDQNFNSGNSTRTGNFKGNKPHSSETKWDTDVNSRTSSHQRHRAASSEMKESPDISSAGNFQRNRNRNSIENKYSSNVPNRSSFEKGDNNRRGKTDSRPNRRHGNFNRKSSVSPGSGLKSGFSDENWDNSKEESLNTPVDNQRSSSKYMKKKIDYPSRDTDSKEMTNEKSTDDVDWTGIKGKGNSPNMSTCVKPKSLPPKQDRRSTNILVPDKIKASAIKCINLNVSDVVKVSVCYVKNPNEFWVQRINDTEALAKINSEMLALSQSKTVLLSPTIDDICGGLYSDNIYYRVRIAKVLPNDSCFVYFIDYGNACVIKNESLYFLTSNLGNYPALALKFKLADIKPKSDGKEAGWSQESIKFFSHMVEYKTLTAHVIALSNATYTVNMMTEEDTSVAFTLEQQNHAETISPESMIPEVNNEMNRDLESLNDETPTLLSKLKVNTTIAVLPLSAAGDVFWGAIVDDEILVQFNELSISLTDPKTADNSMTIEEGELAAACSPADNVWYRAIVLKRKKDSFCVRYIDYGNEEEVRNLRSLTSEQHNICSPSLGFKVISEGHQSKFQEVFVKGFEANASKGFEIIVKSLQRECFEAEVVYDSQTVIKLLGFGWSYDHSSVKPSVQIENDRKPTAPVAVAEHIVQPPSLPKPIGNAEKVKISEGILMEQELATDIKFEVIVTWVKSPNEIYIQRKANELVLLELLQDINVFCSSSERTPYESVEGEIVCARYAADGVWYRSLVLKLLPEHKAKVLFIDYGNEEEIPLQDIEALIEKFRQPVYSICVSLYDLPTAVKHQEVSDKLLNKRFELQVMNATVTPKQVVFYEDGQQVFAVANESAKNKSSSLRQSTKPMSNFSAKRKEDLEMKISDFDGRIVRIEHIDASKAFHLRLISQDEPFVVMQKELNEFCKNNPGTPYFPKIDDLVCVRWKENWNRGYIMELKEDSCLVKLFDRGPILDIVIIDIRPLQLQFFQPPFAIFVSLDSVPKSKLTDKLCESLKTCSYSLELLETSEQPFKCKLYLGDRCINDDLLEETKSSPPPLKSIKPKHLQFLSLQKQTLPLNEVLNVVFWSNEGDLYFLQKESDIEDSGQMALELQEICQKSTSLSELPQIGDLVCAKASDGQWYRACVKEVLPAENRCTVYFVDYGNNEPVSKEDMCIFPPDLIRYLVFCISVKVTNADICPIELMKLTVIKTPTIATDPLVVNVHVPEDCTSIPQVNNKAVEVPPPVHVDPIASNPFSLLHLPTIELPEGDVSLIIYSVFGDTAFVAPSNEENFAANIGLVAAITDYCKEATEKSYKPALQEIVLAKFAVDKSWYRACVQGITDSGYELVFIDYGGYQTTKEEDIRKMTEGFFQLPIQAYACTIGGFKYDERDKEKIDAVIIETLPPFSTDIGAIVSKENDMLVIKIPLFISKLQDMGLIKM